MQSKATISYIVEEYRSGSVQVSKLTTTNIWLACSDFLIKMRSSKKQGLSCKILPTTKTRDGNNHVIFVNAFLLKEGRVYKEVVIRTKTSIEGENKFDRTKTNDYYLSESYLQALKGLVRHLKSFKRENVAGLLALIVFSSVDDNHTLWETYSPNSISDSLKLDSMVEQKANF